MKNFQSVIIDINNTLNKLMFFEVFLNFILVFLAGYLLLSISGFVEPFYAIGIAVAYIVVVLSIKVRKSKIMQVEKSYPMLNEKIRTAADNLDKDNEIVHGLQDEIIANLRHVETSKFLDSKKIGIRVGIAVVLCFLIIFVNSFHYGCINVKSFFPPPRIDGSGQGQGTDAEAEQFAGGAGGVSNIEVNKDIYGSEQVAILGDEELNLQLSQGYEINVRDVKEAKKRVFDEVFPDAIGATSAAAFEENIPREQQEIVNNYFKNLAGE